MSKKSIKSDLKRIDAQGDQDIDYSDIPELDEDFFKTARVVLPPGKRQLTLRLDARCVGVDESPGQGLPEPH